MTPTERLRELLDERGVRYTQTIVTEGTLFTIVTNEEYYFVLVRDNNAGIEMWSQYLTPEQAVEATLGRGECKLDGYTDAAFSACQAPNEKDFIDYAEVCECTACGASIIVPPSYTRVSHDRDELWPIYRFCPHCGAEVVE